MGTKRKRKDGKWYEKTPQGWINVPKPGQKKQIQTPIGKPDSSKLLEVEKLMKDWWWKADSFSRDKAIGIIKSNPEIREKSLDKIDNLFNEDGFMKVYQHESPDGDLSTSYTTSKIVAEQFAEESGGKVSEYDVERNEIFYYTDNSEKELFLTWDYKLEDDASKKSFQPFLNPPLNESATLVAKRFEEIHRLEVLDG